MATNVIRSLAINIVLGVETIVVVGCVDQCNGGMATNVMGVVATNVVVECGN